jgi:hypothetical protein
MMKFQTVEVVPAESLVETLRIRSADAQSPLRETLLRL